jgi:leucyl-tRNA synthetase
MKRYDHTKIEKKWQKDWAKKGLYKTRDKVPGKKNHYLLTEFPYPSGNLHVGHWYAFAVPDIAARALRMQGKNVLYPAGFDAFGLPAENAAIKRGLDPRKWTLANIAYMKKQMASMGASFDWSREVQTIDPAYYRWTQWMFTQFLKKGLAYRKETPVNWCPKDKTVLANEQVVGGLCERCDTPVEQRTMLQWNLRITDYADRLVDDLDAMDWPQQIKDSQKNWIGRSEGAEIDFKVDVGKKYKFVILHGFTSAPDRPRFLWLKRELEKMGHEVILPRLPNTDAPVEEEQVGVALAATTYDEDTVLCGFSLGSVVAMKVLEKLDRPIARLVTAGGFMNRNFKDRPRPFDKTFRWDFDFEKIRRNAGQITILHDVNDYAISDAQASALASALGAPVERVMAEKPHFGGDIEPVVLQTLQPTIRVFTTRPDTLFGATYLVLAPEHPMVAKLSDITNAKEVEEYIAATKRKSDLERQEGKEKTGVKLQGVDAINPATGEKIPVYIADYVLAHYGTGAIMAVPAHDERDFEFAQKFALPIRQVVSGGEIVEKAYTGDGTIMGSGPYDGLTISDAKQKMTAAFGTPKKTYRLRDWIVSRQRYWGVPIPVIHCAQCGAVPVPDKDLPVKLPVIKDYLPTGDGKSPLAKAAKWKQVKCPQCKAWAERETDTLDTFVDSSWYFLRYTDPKNTKQFADKKKMKEWMPVDLYSGGAEHTTMHLLYSRFWHKALYDLKLVNESEPYARRMNRGLIMGPDGAKMSKSRGNVIDPDEIVKRLGADTVRMYLAFIGPFNETGSYPWNPDGVVGVRRFLERVWKLGQPESEKGTPSVYKELESSLHKTIKKVTEDVAALKFNTAIAAMMTFLNEAERDGISHKQFDTLLMLLAPFAPHITEELWRSRGHKKSIHIEKWPKYDTKKMQSLTVTIAVQFNGKVRGTISAQPGSSEADILAIVRGHESLAKHLEGETIRRVIVVPDRLVNIVI